MVWSQIDDIEALRIGIQSEINTYNYYKEALKEIADKDSKELLATLAMLVKKQQKKLKEKYSRLSGNRLLYLNLGKKPTFYNFSSIDTNDLDVLKAAIKHEKNSQIFYEKAAKRTLNITGKTMLKQLAEEDQNQVDLLQIEYNVREKLKHVRLNKNYRI